MSPAEMEMESDKVMEMDPDDCTATGEPKACADCNTTKTPLWRGGPLGPKSLCNACGIRYRKRRRVAMGLDPEAKRKPKRPDLDAALSKATAAEAEASSTQEEEDKDKASSDKKTTKTKTHTLELHMVGFSKDAAAACTGESRPASARRSGPPSSSWRYPPASYMPDRSDTSPSLIHPSQSDRIDLVPYSGRAWKNRCCWRAWLMQLAAS